VKIPKPSDADKQRFHQLTPDAAGIEVKPMFGNLGAFVNGNMFMGLFGSDIGLKLPDDQLETLLTEPGSGPFGPEERPMGGYATLPAGWSSDQVTPWIERALTHAAALPPKVPKRKAKAAASKPARKRP
jgi:TfoX/Sxy family transcriptional regulator of competence genes